MNHTLDILKEKGLSSATIVSHSGFLRVYIIEVAQDGSLRGMLGFILSYASRQCPYIRIDTHRDNVIMRHLLEKHGFRESGTIYIETGDERLAFERMLS